jgi:hypothetical protein
MEVLDLNLSDITTDSLNNLSDISFSSEPQTMQDGGFLSYFCGNKLESAVLDAAKERNYAVIEFMVNKNLISSFKHKDNSGNTLLHYLVSIQNPNVKLIEKILSHKDVKSFINCQNNEGNTPLISAVKAKNHDLCTLLLNHGADKSKKNKNGEHVDTETEEEPSHVSAKEFSMLERTSPIFEVNVSPKEVNEILEPIKKLFARAKKHHAEHTQTSEPSPIEITESELMVMDPKDTDQFIDELQKKLNMVSVSNNQPPTNVNTETTIKQLEKYISDKQTGGGCGCGGNNDTDNIISAIGNYFNTSLSGGAKKKSSTKKSSTKKSGTRKVKKYNDGVMESEEHGTELSRAINNQTGEIINKSIKTIQSIISENKKDFKGLKDDEDTARAIKALIWKSIKDSNPDMKSSLDIAVKMEQMINKQLIKEFTAKDVKGMMDILKKHAAEKESRNKSSDSNTVSSTSSEAVPSESNMSATSI